MKKLILISIVVLSLLSLAGCKKDEYSVLEGTKYATFSAIMRVLWSDHAMWTRNVIFNIADGAPGTTEAVNRLLKNQEDIGDAMKPYFYEAAGNALTDLLKEHINITAELIIAAKNGNNSDYDAAYAAWYVNGDAIAVFLNNANPDHWDLAEWKTMIKNLLDLTLEEVVARLNGDYAADVAAYDKVYAELMIMSDMLSEGIVLQFPEFF